MSNIKVKVSVEVDNNSKIHNYEIKNTKQFKKLIKILNEQHNKY